jgi:hypothetical protein
LRLRDRLSFVRRLRDRLRGRCWSKLATRTVALEEATKAAFADGDLARVEELLGEVYRFAREGYNEVQRERQREGERPSGQSFQEGALEVALDMRREEVRRVLLSPARRPTCLPVPTRARGRTRGRCARRAARRGATRAGPGDEDPDDEGEHHDRRVAVGGRS